MLMRTASRAEGALPFQPIGQRPTAIFCRLNGVNSNRYRLLPAQPRARRDVIGPSPPAALRVFDPRLAHK